MKQIITAFLYLFVSFLVYGQNQEYDIEVPFAVVEKPPIYPGCEEHLQATELKKCFSKKVSDFVNNRFNPKTDLQGRQRINVVFKIDKSGNVSGIRARASSKDLEEQVKTIVSQLPKMKPGYQRNKAVTVPYSLPIVFVANSINQKQTNETQNRRKTVRNNSSNSSRTDKKTTNKKQKDTTNASLRKLFKLEN